MQAFIRVNFHDENGVTEYEIQPSEALYAIFYNEAEALFSLKERFELDVIEQFRPRNIGQKEDIAIHEPYEALKFWARLRNFLRKKAETMEHMNSNKLKAYFELSFSVGEIHSHLEHSIKQKQKIEILFIPG